MSYSPETHFSSLAPPPLRSAMKHSRPSTPAPPGSPVLRYSSPLLAASPPPAGPSRSVTHTPVGSFNGSLSPMLTPHSPSPVVNQGYTPKVGFDTFENPQASMFSYTLHVQSEGYLRTRSTRVFLCASSPDESGKQALEWCLESLVQDGDELVVFRGIDPDDFGTHPPLLPLLRTRPATDAFPPRSRPARQRTRTTTSTARTRTS